MNNIIYENIDKIRDICQQHHKQEIEIKQQK